MERNPSSSKESCTQAVVKVSNSQDSDNETDAGVAGKMVKSKDLSEFDRGQIVMVRLLDQSISKTAALVG
ncbi:hypothetical protein QTP70_027664 [Hemibagrus guttatus]|uniref:Uncharacterized protein n=1 Tax=Hemibagrus guttatus TaxID=175788 RepID=A0AAE0Q1N5_9TELE|nr:hypothetical protein QTP70_027664 [Hemibagrus guttatus]